MPWARKEKRHCIDRQDWGAQEPALLETGRDTITRLDWFYEQMAQFDEIDRALPLLLLDEFSYQQMATTLGLSESNVGVKIHRLKSHLEGKSRKEIHHGL
jgi:RNA polymerase sigma-70 factor (ECF subfamily)